MPGIETIEEKGNISQTEQQKPQGIDWNGRFTTLDPKWKTTARCRNAAGIAWAVLGAVFASAPIAIGVAASVVGTPAVGLAVGLGVASSFWVGAVVSAKKSFSKFDTEIWDNPKYRREQGRKAEEDIVSHNLSYKKIRDKYGDQIDAYQLFERRDLNQFMKKNVQEMSFSTFLETNGRQAFAILEDDNRTIMQTKFTQHIKDQEMSWAAIKENEYDEIILSLDLEKRLIQKALIESDAKKIAQGEMTYRIFRERNPGDHLKLLSEEDRDALKNNEKVRNEIGAGIGLCDEEREFFRLDRR